MRAYELEEYQTKFGNEIDMKYHEDIEGDENRGWQIDKIDAYVNGEYAGYIKMGYIPKKRFKKHYPTVLNYMDKMGGHIILPRDNRDANYKNLSDDDLKFVVQHLAYQTKYHNIWSSSGKEGMPETREELLVIIEDIIKNSRNVKEQFKDFKQFRNYFVDKPYVDYIRVFREGENRYDRSTDNDEIGRASRDYQRQRIGTALYLEAGEWLKKRGMKLYASGTQSDEAQAAWANLEKMGLVGKDGKRRFLRI